MLSRIWSLINEIIREEDRTASLLSEDDVLQLIGEFFPKWHKNSIILLCLQKGNSAGPESQCSNAAFMASD